MKRLLAFVPLILLAAIALAFAIGLSKDPRALPSQLIDKPVPNFSLQVVPGTDLLAPEDLAGKVSIVSIFGSWCVACLQEHPTLMQIARQGDVPVYGVAWRDTGPDAAQWLTRHGNPYVKTGLDPHSKLAIDLGVTGAPESFIIDKTGHIRFKQTGPITPDVWINKIQPIIEHLQSEPAK